MQFASDTGPSISDFDRAGITPVSLEGRGVSGSPQQRRRWAEPEFVPYEDESDI